MSLLKHLYISLLTFSRDIPLWKLSNDREVAECSLSAAARSSLLGPITAYPQSRSWRPSTAAPTTRPSQRPIASGTPSCCDYLGPALVWREETYWTASSRPCGRRGGRQDGGAETCGRGKPSSSSDTCEKKWKLKLRGKIIIWPIGLGLWAQYYTDIPQYHPSTSCLRRLQLKKFTKQLTV